MKNIALILLALMLLFCLTLLGALTWFAMTPEGARRLMLLISNHSPVKISATTVEGHILGDLQLAGLKVKLPQQEIATDRLVLKWRPLELINGRLSIETLTLQALHIDDLSPVVKKEPQLKWPEPPPFPAWLDVWVDRLAVDNLRYRRRGSNEVRVGKLSGHLFWHDHTLSLRDLSLKAPDGQLAGELMAGFAPAALRSDLMFTLTKPAGGLSSFSIKTRAAPHVRTEQLAVNTVIEGYAGGKSRYVFSGDLGMERNSFNLRGGRLSRPGRQGAITAEGKMALTRDLPFFDLKAGVQSLDLYRDTGVSTNLSGDLSFQGTTERYRGAIRLANRGEGWREGAIRSSFAGDRRSLHLDRMVARALGGTAQGSIVLGWEGGVSVAGELATRNINPSIVNPAWRGVVNADLAGNLAWLRTGHSGSLHAQLLHSVLRDQPLEGKVDLTLSGEDVKLQDLALKGNGFTLTASGDLARRIEFAAAVDDLSGLVPGSAGEFAGSGWVRWHDRALSGSLTGRGRNLSGKGVSVALASVDARVLEGKDHPLEVRATLQDAVYHHFRSDMAELSVSGTLATHLVEARLNVGPAGAPVQTPRPPREAAASGAFIKLAASGAYRDRKWTGEIIALSGQDQVGPWSVENRVELSASPEGFIVSPMGITGSPGERLLISGNFRRESGTGSLHAEWNGLNMARVNQWVEDTVLDGMSEGRADLEMLSDQRLKGKADLRASGRATFHGEELTLTEGALHLDVGSQGIAADVLLDLAAGGKVVARFSSRSPARLALPETGSISGEWTGLDIALLRSRLPSEARAEGRMSGRFSGQLLPGGNLALDGTSSLEGGRVVVRKAEGEMTVGMQKLDLSWRWRGTQLTGNVELVLSEFGKMKGEVSLPLPAVLPVAFNPQGPVRGTLKGRTRELGIITAFLPGVLQESKGELGIDLRLAGTWSRPDISGGVSLERAGAYIPSAGVRLENLQLDAEVRENLLKVTRFEVNSGPGYLSGEGEARLEGWRLAAYHGKVQGELFQTTWLPEVQALTSPRLTFDGAPGKLTVRGVVQVPVLYVYGPASRAPVEPSSDVVYEGAQPENKAEAKNPLALDLEVAVLLGDRVYVQAKGIDASMGGGMTLTGRRSDRIVSRGEIKVIRGRYKAYGLDLDIVRGRLFYAGTPLNQPTLDILALRTVADVKAGVTVGGTLQVPVVKLYSEPAMPDVDILSYMVLGHPMGGTSSEQAGVLSQAAGFLFSSGQSVVLQDEIKNRLGLSTLEIESQGKTPGYMGGYKPVQVAPPGKGPAQTQGELSETMLTVGKYLTPELYISYGRSLFTGSNLFRLRYDISKHWQVESETGAESGADIYFKIEFD